MSPASHYFKVLAMKTAELFALSCQLGGFLSKAAAPRREALRQYGLALGTAYQLYDDCLDVLGSEAAAGKTLGADLAKGKMTLPVLDRARPRHAGGPASIAGMAGELGPGPPGRRGGVDREIRRVHRMPRTVIQHYLSAARQALAALPASEGRAKLAG